MLLSPEAFYDLTAVETAALLHGQQRRDIGQWQQTRLVAVLLRNAHYKDPVSLTEFLPLPGDDQLGKPTPMLPEEAFHLLAQAMGATIIEGIEP